jgi:hypothetical protein
MPPLGAGNRIQHSVLKPRGVSAMLHDLAFGFWKERILQRMREAKPFENGLQSAQIIKPG